MLLKALPLTALVAAVWHSECHTEPLVLVPLKAIQSPMVSAVGSGLEQSHDDT